jgi:hypothetical protein
LRSHAAAGIHEWGGIADLAHVRPPDHDGRCAARDLTAERARAPISRARDAGSIASCGALSRNGCADNVVRITEDDGLTGRSVASLELAPDLGIVRLILGANFGGVYGAGVPDGLVAGPEIGLDISLLHNVAMRALAAYDYQFRNSGDFDEAILRGGLNFGVRF